MSSCSKIKLPWFYKMKKLILITTISSALMLTGCDYFKKKKEDSVAALSEWSCTNPENIDHIQKYLKNEYLSEVQKSIETSGYSADQALLQKINDGLKFEIKNVRTITADPSKTNQLECESQLLVQFPKGLQQRAENAFVEYQELCEECEERSTSLRNYVEEGESKLTLANDQLKGRLNYNVVKTDQDGLTLDVMNQDAVIQGVTFVAAKAVLYESYMNENKRIKEQADLNATADAEQTVLAQKSMDIRKKELDEEQVKQVDRLNQTWDRLSDEKKAQTQQDQTDWFEKRNVDCKVISQKSVGEIAENDRETYQRQYAYWDENLRQQNQAMQYAKCFNQRTAERIIYLNNSIN